MSLHLLYLQQPGKLLNQFILTSKAKDKKVFSPFLFLVIQNLFVFKKRFFIVNAFKTTTEY